MLVALHRRRTSSRLPFHWLTKVCAVPVSSGSCQTAVVFHLFPESRWRFSGRGRGPRLLILAVPLHPMAVVSQYLCHWISSHSFNFPPLRLSRGAHQRPLLVSGQRPGASRPSAGAGTWGSGHPHCVLPMDCPLLPDWGGTLKSQMLSRGEQEQENGSPIPACISVWGREAQSLPFSLVVGFQAGASGRPVVRLLGVVSIESLWAPAQSWGAALEWGTSR